MIPGYRAFPCFNMVQFEGICLIHLPDLLFGNFPGKVKVSLFVSAAPVSPVVQGRAVNGRAGRYLCGTDKRRILNFSRKNIEK